MTRKNVPSAEELREAEDDEKLAYFYPLVASALVRGGHKQPPLRVLLAAVNYAIREDMSRLLIQQLEARRTALRWDSKTRTLEYLLTPDDDDVRPMRIARVPVKGPVEYL